MPYAVPKKGATTKRPAKPKPKPPTTGGIGGGGGGTLPFTPIKSATTNAGGQKKKKY
jgi:hypothetical protein